MTITIEALEHRFLQLKIMRILSNPKAFAEVGNVYRVRMRHTKQKSVLKIATFPPPAHASPKEKRKNGQSKPYLTLSSD